MFESEELFHLKIKVKELEEELEKAENEIDYYEQKYTELEKSIAKPAGAAPATGPRPDAPTDRREPAGSRSAEPGSGPQEPGATPPPCPVCDGRGSVKRLAPEQEGAHTGVFVGQPCRCYACRGTGRAPASSPAPAAPEGCKIDLFSSGVCEAGTKSCVIKHPEASGDRPYASVFPYDGWNLVVSYKDGNCMVGEFPTGEAAQEAATYLDGFFAKHWPKVK